MCCKIFQKYSSITDSDLCLLLKAEHEYKKIFEGNLAPESTGLMLNNGLKVYQLDSSRL